MVESGEEGVEPDSYWKKKEAFFRGSTVSLGEKFSSGTFKDAFTIVHCLTCTFYISQSKLVIVYTQKYSPCLLYLFIIIKHSSLSTNVLLTQQFSSFHHIPQGPSSQMDLNSHTKSPVRSLIAMLFPKGLTLCSQSISQKYVHSWKIFNEVLKVLSVLIVENKRFHFTLFYFFPLYSVITDRKIQ